MSKPEPGTDPADLAALPPQEVEAFLRQKISEKRLTPLVRRLNTDMLSKDAGRRAMAESALRRIGLL